MMLNDISNYLFFSSFVLIYGIGINRVTVTTKANTHFFLQIIKMLITIIGSAILTYIVNIYLLSKIDMQELYPFVAVLIFSLLTGIVEMLIKFSLKIDTSEFAISLLCVILSVNESTSILQCVLLSVIGVLSFYLLLPFISAIKKRIEICHPEGDFRNSSLILISVAVIIVILFAWNVSWLNQGVFQ